MKINGTNVSNVSMDLPDGVQPRSSARPMPSWGEWIMHPPEWFLWVVAIVSLIFFAGAAAALWRNDDIMQDPAVRADLARNIFTVFYAVSLASITVGWTSYYVAVVVSGVGGWLLAIATLRFPGVRENLISPGEPPG